MMDDQKKPHDLDLTPIDDLLDQEIAEQHAQEDREDQEVDLGKLLKLSSRRDERRVGLYLLYAIERSEFTRSLEGLLHQYEQEYGLVIPMDSYPRKSVDGVIQNHARYDEELKPFLKNWSLERLGVVTKLILYLAVWELEQEGAIPSIVINEAVELSKEFAEKDAYKFVNGILDEVAKKYSEPPVAS